MMCVTYFGPYSEGFIAGFANIMPPMTPGGKTTPALPPLLQDQHPTFIKNLSAVAQTDKTAWAWLTHTHTHTHSRISVRKHMHV